MVFRSITPPASVALFVKDILIFEEDASRQKTVLPFFADGYPGMIYCESEDGLVVTPHNKKMPEFFLYGQTIKPIQLILDGRYKLIIMQLYPFVLKSFFQINPVLINDNCYDLTEWRGNGVGGTTQSLNASHDTDERVKILTGFLHSIFQQKKQTLDYKIRDAIQALLESGGRQSIQTISKNLKLNPRTFERRFKSEVGIQPKQFAQITQFHISLKQLTSAEFTKLTEVVYKTGFADQSHFIRVFKKFTGTSPSAFKKR